MNTYEKIVLRKDSGKLTLNGYYPAGKHGVRTFDVLYLVSMEQDGPLHLSGKDWIVLRQSTEPLAGVTWHHSWQHVSEHLMDFHGLPLYGLHKADAQVMDFLREREKMQERALMEYVLPKGQRKGFPPGRMDDQAIEKVESFADWKRRKDHWESVQEKSVASPS